MKTLDCRDHKCPYPVIEARKAILESPGDPVTVLVGDETARQNVSRLAASQGYEVRTEDTERGFSLYLTPGSSKEQSQGPVIQGKTVIFVASDVMGSGDDELGHILMKNYLITLLELQSLPDTIFFVNAGIKLTTVGSNVLEALERLACQGVDIASCGLCLEFFHLKEKLAAGRTTNMLEIAETLQSAGRVIRP